MTMTKTERTELRGLVRQRFRVLRHEVEQRQRELTAEVDQHIVERHRTRDEKRQELVEQAEEIARRAQREISDLLRRSDVSELGPHSRGYIGLEPPRWGDDGRHELRRAALSDLEAKVKAATLRLDREEVDLLQALAIGALETDEAKAFLAKIPTVSELVPAARMAELESQLESAEGNDS